MAVRRRTGALRTRRRPHLALARRFAELKPVQRSAFTVQRCRSRSGSVCVLVRFAFWFGSRSGLVRVLVLVLVLVPVRFAFGSTRALSAVLRDETSSGVTLTRRTPTRTFRQSS